MDHRRRRRRQNTQHICDLGVGPSVTAIGSPGLLNSRRIAIVALPGFWASELEPRLARWRCSIYGKSSLGAGEEWRSPTNALDRFFTVGVEMAE